MHVLGLVVNSLKTCRLLAIVRLFTRFSASFGCVSIMSVVVLWHALLSSSVAVYYVVIIVDNSDGTSFACFPCHNVIIGGQVFESCLLFHR